MEHATLAAPPVAAADAGARPSSRLFTTCVAASVILHGAAIAWLIASISRGDSGYGGTELDVVSLEVVSSTTSGSTAEQSNAGGAQSSAQEAVAGHAALHEERTEVEPLAKPRDVQMAELKSDPAPAIPPEVAEIELGDQDKQVAEARREAVAATAQAASEAAPSAIAASSDRTQTIGATGASAGELNKYAVEVRLALGQSRPLHSGRHGKVTVSFGLLPDGAVRYVEIARSSGSSELDQAVIGAVQRTRFPPPPLAMTETQRTYVVPFEFR